jgi:adenine phosphoribosyltransferase
VATKLNFTMAKKLEDYIITIPDFPEPGIMFRDVTSVLDSSEGLRLSIDSLYGLLEGVDYDVIAGAEARGFIFGMPLAYKAGKPFVPVRKKGKLPRATYSQTYNLEYGTATIEIHKDSIKPGQRVVLVDDLIATGGTIEAAAHLIEKCGGVVVKILFLIELEGLGGRKKLSQYDVASVVKYEGK